MKINKQVISAIVVAVITAGAGFAGGMKYEKTRVSKSFDQRPSFRTFNSSAQVGGMAGNGGGNVRFGRGGMGGGFIAGEILSKDDKSITLKSPDGGSKIVFYSASTAIGKFASTTPSDLTMGEQVAVMGTQNSDGSITAQNIQIRPNLQLQAK